MCSWLQQSTTPGLLQELAIDCNSPALVLLHDGSWLQRSMQKPALGCNSPALGPLQELALVCNGPAPGLSQELALSCLQRLTPWSVARARSGLLASIPSWLQQRASLQALSHANRLQEHVFYSSGCRAYLLCFLYDLPHKSLDIPIVMFLIVSEVLLSFSTIEGLCKAM